MPRAKKKAQETQVSEDDISNDDSAQTLPAKKRKKSSKQEKLGEILTSLVSEEFKALQKLVAKLERENKALKQSQAQAASQLVNNDDSDTGDANVENINGGFSPEEEDTGFDTFQSPSQGTIQVNQPPFKRLTHCVNDSKTPVIAMNTRQEHSPTPAALPA
ncbi:hypothetical protein BC835DRAFT_1413429 [Cytidiella melzeri]|nr:hypothetical protein BC835DRAFT_1413429 [Cytidiella melzeri]